MTHSSATPSAPIGELLDRLGSALMDMHNAELSQSARRKAEQDYDFIRAIIVSCTRSEIREPSESVEQRITRLIGVMKYNAYGNLWQDASNEMADCTWTDIANAMRAMADLDGAVPSATRETSREALKLAEQWKGRADDAGLLSRTIIKEAQGG